MVCVSHAFLRRHIFFANAPATFIDGIAQALLPVRFDRKSVIYRQGDPASSVYFVGSGSVHLSRFCDDGREISLCLLGSGDLLGDDAVFDEAALRSAQATCIADIALYALHASTLRKLLAREASVAVDFASYMQVKRDEALFAVERMAAACVRERIVWVMRELARMHGTHTTEGVRIDVRLTRTQIAALTGSTRETVSLEISRLIRAGRLATLRHHFILPSVQASDTRLPSVKRVAASA